MNEAPNGHNDDVPGFEELRELNDAIKAGFRRASMHWMRAGYELVAGLSAFLDEIAEAGKEDGEPVDPRPTKIQLD